MFKPKPGARLEVHSLKAHSINFLNRDDSGRLKSAIIGGKNRLRHSSQAIKFAIKNNDIFVDFRSYAKDSFAATATYRTRLIVEKLKFEIKKQIENAGLDYDKHKEEVEQNLADFPLLFSKKISSNHKILGETQLLTFTETDIEEVVNKIITIANKHVTIKPFDLYKKAISSKKLRGLLSTDLPLFGRFSTSNDCLTNINCPLQVAHAFTVHESQQQRDYWTASDDLSRQLTNNAGSAHLNVRMLGTGVYYSYCCLDVPLLTFNIKNSFADHLSPGQQLELTQDLVSAFLYTFLCSGLAGGQTGHANHDLSEAAFITFSGAFPYSASAAFEAPVQANRNGGYLEPAKERFNQWITDREKRYNIFMGASASMGLTDNQDRDLNSLVEWAIEQITPMAHKKLETN